MALIQSVMPMVKLWTLKLRKASLSGITLHTDTYQCAGSMAYPDFIGKGPNQTYPDVFLLLLLIWIITIAYSSVLPRILSYIWTREVVGIPEFGALVRGGLEPHKLDAYIWSECPIRLNQVDGIQSHSTYKPQIYPALNFFLNSRLLYSSTQLTTWKPPEILTEPNVEHSVSIATWPFPRLSTSKWSCPAFFLFRPSSRRHSWLLSSQVCPSVTAHTFSPWPLLLGSL